MRKWRLRILTALRSESANLYCQKSSRRPHACARRVRDARISGGRPISSSPPWAGRRPPAVYKRSRQQRDASSSEVRGRGAVVEPSRHRSLPGPARSGSAVTPGGALPSFLGAAERAFPPVLSQPRQPSSFTWRCLPAPGTSPRAAGKEPLPQGAAVLLGACPRQGRSRAPRAPAMPAVPHGNHRAAAESRGAGGGGESRCAGRRRKYRDRAGSEQENAPCRAERGEAAPPDHLPIPDRILLSHVSAACPGMPRKPPLVAAQTVKDHVGMHVFPRVTAWSGAVRRSSLRHVRAPFLAACPFPPAFPLLSPGFRLALPCYSRCLPLYFSGISVCSIL